MITKVLCLSFLLGAALFLAMAACSPAEPTPFPTMTVPPSPTASLTPQPTETPTPVPLETIAIEEGGFTLELPRTWQLAGKGLTAMGSYYQLGPSPLGPGPASSTLFIANAQEVAPADAAELLLCGDGCAGAVTLAETTVAGQPALQATIGDPPLEWFFIETGDLLIYFTLHDPLTLETRRDLVDSLEFAGQAVAQVPDATPAPTNTPRPTATPTATSSPTPPPTPASYELETVREWEVIDVEAADLAYNVPADWEPASSGFQWSPPEAPDLLLGFDWTQTERGAEPAVPAPEGAVVASTEPFTPTWSVNPDWTQAVSSTVGTPPLWEQHIFVQVGLRQYDFYSRGPASTALPALRPLLREMVASVTVRDALVYVEDPINGAVEWFRAALRDPSGREARPYMSERLKAEVPEGDNVLALMALPSPISTFNLAGVGSPTNSFEIEATLELFNGDTVTRTLNATFDEAIGWRLDAISAE